MAELIKTNQLIDAYAQPDQIPHFRDILTKRVKTPILADGTNLWQTWLDAKEQNIYKKIKGQRPRFKIDHEFPLESLVGADINSDGTITIPNKTYRDSEGTEFIIIQDSNLSVAYAIRSDKYSDIRRKLSSGSFNEKYLKDAGAFKINDPLSVEEVPTHDGWLELTVKTNKATLEQYHEAASFLETQYVPEAQKHNCFTTKGMGFFVRTDQENTEVRPWFVLNSDGGSDAGGGNNFGDFGRFLRVGCSAEGTAPDITPENIAEYLARTPVKDETFAATLLKAANEFYQKR